MASWTLAAHPLPPTRLQPLWPRSLPVWVQCFMLTTKHRELLRERYGVHVWHVEQYEHEAVFIPGGCAHQVGLTASACAPVARSQP